MANLRAGCAEHKAIIETARALVKALRAHGGCVGHEPEHGWALRRAQRPSLWTRDQLRRFLDGTREHWLSPLWTLLAYSGVRLSEALALTWTDVDLAAGRVTICKAVQRIGSEWVVAEPKTEAGARAITLPPEAIEALERRAEKVGAHCAGKVSAQDGPNPDKRMVFAGERDGGVLGHSTVGHAMRRECRRLGLPPVTPHGLRHLHASLLLASGVPIPAASQRLGHATSAITMRVYAHALGEDDSRATAAIERALAR